MNRTRSQLLLLIACSVALAAACSASVGVQSRPSTAAAVAPGVGEPTGVPENLDLSAWPPEEFWLQATPGGMEVNNFGSFDGLVRGSDLVVIGRALEVVGGRPIPPEAGAPEMGFGTILFKVEEVITGEMVATKPDVISVEFLMGDARLLPRYQKRVPQERVMLFLRNKGRAAEERGEDASGPFAGLDHYVILSHQGYLRENEGVVEAPISADNDWLRELVGLELKAVAERVRDVRP